MPETLVERSSAPLEAGSEPPGESPRRTIPRLRPRVWQLVVLSLVVVGALVLLSMSLIGSSPVATLRASGIPRDVSTGTANLMQLAPVPSEAAPDFTLVDQNGRAMSLSSFLGHPVVLEFMDPHCTDICPIVSKEFIDAYKDLGAQGDGTEFVAVNVNRYNTSMSDLASYSNEQGLENIPTWHFFTGPVPSLQSVWKSYGIYVYAPNPEADVIHTSIVFFIDRSGHERFTAVPADDHSKDGTAYLPLSQQAAWGHGIARVVKALT